MEWDDDGRLHELLQLKKAERPVPEFWADFDRQLRSRCLQELVRPAWKTRFHRLFNHLFRPSMATLLIGAAMAYPALCHFCTNDLPSDPPAQEYVCQAVNDVAGGKKLVQSEMGKAQQNISYVLGELTFGGGHRLAAYDF